MVVPVFFRDEVSLPDREDRLTRGHHSLFHSLTARVALLAGALAVLSTGAVRADFPEVPEPVLPPPAQAPDFDPSFLTLPIRITLDDMLAELETRTPREAGTEGSFVPYTDRKNGKTAEARYRLWRDPFVLSIEDDVVTIRADVFYWLEARGEDFGSDACGSEEEPIACQIGFRSVFAWGDGWSLETQVSQIPTVHRGRCKPAAAGINFSRLLVPLVDEAFTSHALSLFPAIVRESDDLSRIVAEAWAVLQEPVSFSSYEMWLTHRPAGALASPIIPSGRALTTEVALQVRPRLLVGDRPDSETNPLPDTRVRLFDPNLAVAFDCGITLASIEQALVDFCGESVPALPVASARVFGGDDRIAVGLTVGGEVEGIVYAVGTMEYDGESNLLSARDLQFTEESVAALRQVIPPEDAATLTTDLDALLACVQSCCSSNIGPAVDTYLKQLGRGLNFEMSPGFSVSGGIRTRETVGVYVTDRIAGVRQIAKGHGALEYSP